MKTSRRALKTFFAAALTCLFVFGSGATASAGQTTADGSGPRVSVSPDADPITEEWARENPQAAASGPDICGPKWTWIHQVDPDLPGDSGEQDGVLIGYFGGGGLCVVFYNTTSDPAPNYMYLRACPGSDLSNPYCAVDSGNFSSYAGPLYISTDANGCFSVIVRLRQQDGTGYLIDGSRRYYC